MTAARKLVAPAVQLRHTRPVVDENSPLASIYLAAAQRHRARNDDPTLVAALVRAAWRELARGTPSND
ncbi:MAG: hypothetical protein IT379_18175 [Deltaproteobacteria bacterium]|nr:hypothetical protein [Deltaproteobacteria bacterium]